MALDAFDPDKARQRITYEASRRELMRQGGSNGSFSPNVPVAPWNGVEGLPRAWNFPTGYNLRTRADREGRISFDAMKKITNNYEIARICIQHRIDDVRSLTWQIIPDPELSEAEAKDVSAAARDIMESPDGVRDFRNWFAMYAEDVLRYDAGCLARRFNRGGEVIGLEVVSGTTIAPVLDGWGRRPAGDAPAYVQFVNGTPWKWFPARSLIYEPFRPQPDSAYGWAPIESVVLSANTTMRIQNHWLNWYLEGTMPAGFATLPESINSPDQLRDWQETYSAQYAGDDAAKHQLRFVPYNTHFEWPKANKFDPDQADFLMRITCAAYSVTPNDLGFTEDVNRATGDTQVDVQFRTGTLPLLRYFEDTFTRHLRKDRGLRVRFSFDTGQEAEERQQMSKVWEAGVRIGAASNSEYRQHVLSLPVDQVPTPRGVITANGIFMPNDAMVQAAGQAGDGQAPHVIFPASVQSGAAPDPADGTAVPERPAPADAALAKRDIPQSERDQMDDSDFAGPHESFPITKPEDVASAAHLVGKADDPAAVKARIIAIAHRKGPEFVAKLPASWRVSKAMAAPSCAGLCLIANDTGRILMIQRELTEDDPAGGKWEFPGGHLEPGETPVQGAVREWQEETGRLLPGGLDVFPVADNGTYQLFATVMEREDLVDFGGDRQVNNPDGDCFEACAWWDPTDAAVNPALRAECAETPWAVIARLAAGSMDGVKPTIAKWQRQAISRVTANQPPRKFVNSGLPVSIETRIWKKLRTAKDEAAVRDAFETAF